MPRCLHSAVLFLSSLVATASGGGPTLRDDTSPLLTQLLHTLGCGDNDCQRVTHLARAALLEPSTGLRAVASLNPHNGERALKAWVKRQAWNRLAPSTYEFMVNYKDANKDNIEARPGLHSALLPHEMFHTLFTYAPEVFRHILAGTDDDLRAWWQGAQESDPTWHDEHEVVQRVADPVRRIPYGIHGDDAGMQGKTQVLAITWGSLVRLLPTLDTRLAFTMVRVVDIVPEDTLLTIFNVLGWSLDALSRGQFPKVDHNGTPFSNTHYPDRYKMAGKPLAGGLVGAFGELRGDWKFLKETLFLKRNYMRSDFICHLCDATKNDPRSRYTDFRRTAPHRCTLINDKDWMRAALAATVFCPLLLVAGFSIWRTFFDVMHTFDLGIYQVLVPSCLKDLVQEGYWAGHTVAERYIAAFADYRSWARLHKLKDIPRKFQRNTWGKGYYPKISQIQAKAACLRSMTYWMAEVCSRPLNVANAHGQLRAAMMESFVAFDKHCRRFGRHLAPDQHELLSSTLERALTAYNALAVEAAACEPAKRLWKCIPKMHAATHYYDNAINPRAVQCYQDEDMVRRLTMIYNKVHGGKKAPQRSLWRYKVIMPKPALAQQMICCVFVVCVCVCCLCFCVCCLLFVFFCCVCVCCCVFCFVLLVGCVCCVVF